MIDSFCDLLVVQNKALIFTSGRLINLEIMVGFLIGLTFINIIFTVWKK